MLTSAEQDILKITKILLVLHAICTLLFAASAIFYVIGGYWIFAAVWLFGTLGWIFCLVLDYKNFIRWRNLIHDRQYGW